MLKPVRNVEVIPLTLPSHYPHLCELCYISVKYNEIRSPLWQKWGKTKSREAHSKNTNQDM